ncbi:MAG: hypothetical protein Wins2KO_17150 [Winogradskyella sp.]
MLKKLFLLVFVVALCNSCSSSDDGGGGESNCADPMNQTAQGNFRGDNFVSPGGTFILAPGGNNGYSCTIYVENRTNNDCVFPEFGNGLGDQDSIKFPIDDLSLSSYNYTDTGGSAINFNRIEANSVTTTAELATCGTVTITAYDANAETLTGTITANGQDGSQINGTFVLDLCVF